MHGTPCHVREKHMPHTINATHRLLTAALLLSAFMHAASAEAPAWDEPIVFHPDTSWCWFQDPRMLLDDGRLLLSGVSAEGDITVTLHDLESGGTTTSVLHERLDANDHAVPALMVLPDGRYLASYSRHNDDVTRFRTSERPGDISAWRPEEHFDHGAPTTYSNLYRLAGEGPNGRIYNFIRALERDPCFIISDDDGATWRKGGRVVDGGGDGQRPYARYAGDGVDTIHFITTEQHPRRFHNGIYHGYLRGGKAYQSDGTLVNEDIFRDEAPPADAFTRVFAGDENNVAWTSDIELDEHGHPYIAYSVMKDPLPMETDLRGLDHRYRYARWDGARWHDHEIAYAGSHLYHGENEYTGLITLHPGDPGTVFISADVHPQSGAPLLVNGARRYEIFMGQTTDHGATWQWTPLTQNSPRDNLRPITTAQGGTWALAWLHGHYRSYTDYDQAAIGFIRIEEGHPMPLRGAAAAPGGHTWISDPSAKPLPRQEFPPQRRFRILADFNGDGIEDMALSTDTRMFGNAGGWFSLYLGNGEGKYREYDGFFAHPLAISLERRHEMVRLWTYHRGGGASGMLGFRRVEEAGLSAYERIQIHPGDGGTRMGNAMMDAVFDNSDIPILVESGDMVDGEEVWSRHPTRRDLRGSAEKP